MFGSIYIGRFFGIRVSLHFTFLLLVLYIFISTSSGEGGLGEAVWMTAFVLAGFVCITLHEFGHALMARRFGIGTRSITLLPIGGLASLEKIPEKPGQELLVSIAGPMVNVVIGTVLIGVVILTGGIPLQLMPENRFLITPENFLSVLMIGNFILAVFNMVPAFPMDGGRVFRALLAFKLGRLKATRIASWLGQALAAGFVIYSIMNGEFLNILVGAFIFLGAQAEYQQVKSQSLLGGFKVRDILMRDYTIFHPYQRLSEAASKLPGSQEKNFLVAKDSFVEGILTTRDIVQGLATHGGDEMVGRVLTKEVPVLDINQPLGAALEIFQKTGIPLLPVMEEGRIAGVLDLENVKEFLMIRSVQSR